MSYLTDHASYDSSAHFTVKLCIPQGSGLGTLLYSVYMLSPNKFIYKHDISFHFYAKGTQVYI